MTLDGNITEMTKSVTSIGVVQHILRLLNCILILRILKETIHVLWAADTPPEQAKLSLLKVTVLSL